MKLTIDDSDSIHQEVNVSNYATSVDIYINDLTLRLSHDQAQELLKKLLADLE